MFPNVHGNLPTRTAECLHGLALRCAHTFTFATFDCLAASNWPPGHPRSDHHVSNPHRPDYN